MQQFTSPSSNFPTPEKQQKPNQGVRILFFIVFCVVIGFISLQYLLHSSVYIDWPYLGGGLLITEGKIALLFTYIGSTLFSAIFLSKRLQYTKRFIYATLAPLPIHFLYFMALWDFEMRINQWLNVLIFWSTIPVALTFLTIFFLKITLREE